MNKLSAWWEAYKKKETVWGHISNVVFILFVIAMIFPASRQVVSSNLIKLTLFDRGEIDPVKNPVKLSGADWGIPFYKDGEALPLGAFCRRSNCSELLGNLVPSLYCRNA